jgi:hypothetical protein
MTDTAITAAGRWTLGDLTVNRLGFGAMRLTGRAPFDGGPPSDRAEANSRAPPGIGAHRQRLAPARANHIGLCPGLTIFTTCLPPRVPVQPLASSSRFIDRWLCRTGLVRVWETERDLGVAR